MIRSDAMIGPELRSAEEQEQLRGRRLPALDGLRALAAAMVFVHHSELPGLTSVTHGLDAGVLIFFSLSGYLLYAPFVAARAHGGRIDLASYAIRRVARLLPAYVLASWAIAAIWYPWFLADPIGLLTGVRSPILIVWTLQLEVAFYALLPALVWVLGRFGPQARIRVLFVVAIVSVVFTGLVMAARIGGGGAVSTADLSSILSYAWAFIPGMVVAELEPRWRLERRVRAAAGVLGLVLIAGSVAANPLPFFDIPASVGSALVIAAIVSRPFTSTRWIRVASRVMIGAGAISYAVYLWHKSIVDVLNRPEPTWGGAALAALATIAIAVVSYLAVERPVIRLGSRIADAVRRPG